MVIGTVLLALVNPYVIGVAVFCGLAFSSARGIWIGALLAGLTFRVTWLFPATLPFSGFFDIGTVLWGGLGAFFWAAFANCVLRPFLAKRFGKKAHA